MTFQYPWLLLLLLIPIIFYFIGWNKKESSIHFSATQLFEKSSARVNIGSVILSTLKYLIFTLFVIALARPQLVDARRDFSTEGIDIMIALDISGSMLAEDFRKSDLPWSSQEGGGNATPTNRIDVAKLEAADFIKGRQNDRIGLVVFAQQSFTQCPLTLDYDVLLELLSQVEVGLIEDGTAIGLAIANSINRLRNSEAKSKVIILITDGANNAGKIDPITAAELAKKFNIKIYTIGVGKEGLVAFPVQDPVFGGKRYIQARVEIDEETLKEAAKITGGLYFRAQSQKSLQEIYKTIDSLEKTELEVREYFDKQEIYNYFLLPAVIFFLIQILLQNTILLKIP